MEIEVGRYGRTNTGKIFIFAWLEKSEGIRDKNKVLLGNGKTFENKFYYFEENEEIVKHSKKLIDLIEEGDYVNGYKVLDVAEDLSTRELHLEMVSNCPTPECNCQLYNKDIKSIATKEQFANIEYKIEKGK